VLDDLPASCCHNSSHAKFIRSKHTWGNSELRSADCEGSGHLFVSDFTKLANHQ